MKSKKRKKKLQEGDSISKQKEELHLKIFRDDRLTNYNDLSGW